MAESCDRNQKHPVLAVVGPTATGKTALGVALAEAFEGEVISADSMQIYKGLDVGTAKVAPEETHGIPHHAVDILEPDEPFSVADFVTLAGTLEADISARGRLPILVGGTGLYVQSFLYGVRFAAEKTPDGLREQLAAEMAEKGPEAMYKELQTADPEAAAAIHRTIRCGSCGRWTFPRHRQASERAEGPVPPAGAALSFAGAGSGLSRPRPALPPHRPAGGQDAGRRPPR